MSSTKVEAEMGVGTDFLICAREADCGKLLPNWIAAAINPQTPPPPCLTVHWGTQGSILFCHMTGKSLAVTSHWWTSSGIRVCLRQGVCRHFPEHTGWGGGGGMRLLIQITFFWWFSALDGPRIQVWCLRAISKLFQSVQDANAPHLRPFEGLRHHYHKRV